MLACVPTYPWTTLSCALTIFESYQKSIRWYGVLKFFKTAQFHPPCMHACMGTVRSGSNWRFEHTIRKPCNIQYIYPMHVSWSKLYAPLISIYYSVIIILQVLNALPATLSACVQHNVSMCQATISSSRQEPEARSCTVTESASRTGSHSSCTNESVNRRELCKSLTSLAIWLLLCDYHNYLL